MSVSDSCTFRILQRETQFLGQTVDGRSLSFPRAVGFEAQCPDSPAPWRDDATDGAEVRPIRVLLIDPLQDIRRDTNERAEGRRRADRSRIPTP